MEKENEQGDDDDMISQSKINAIRRMEERRYPARTSVVFVPLGESETLNE